MKTIHVLGTGCKKCVSLKENVAAAVAATGIEATIEKVEDINEIVKYGVMSTPALVVDGQVKITGKVATVDEIAKVLKE
jgi:small redox-active disulfide protein 2